MPGAQSRNYGLSNQCFMKCVQGCVWERLPLNTWKIKRVEGLFMAFHHDSVIKDESLVTPLLEKGSVKHAVNLLAGVFSALHFIPPAHNAPASN